MWSAHFLKLKVVISAPLFLPFDKAHVKNSILTLSAPAFAGHIEITYRHVNLFHNNVTYWSGATSSMWQTNDCWHCGLFPNWSSTHPLTLEQPTLWTPHIQGGVV